MSFVDGLKIAAIVALGIIYLIPKKNGYEYNALDKKGVISNIILSVIYVPMSIAGVCMVFFADNPMGLTQRQLDLLHSAIYLGISVPIVSITSIVASAIMRKRGKSKFSFAIQFLPIAIFVIAIILWACSSLINPEL